MLIKCAESPRQRNVQSFGLTTGGQLGSNTQLQSKALTTNTLVSRLDTDLIPDQRGIIRT